jgi:hypothetical protein
MVFPVAFRSNGGQYASSILRTVVRIPDAKASMFGDIRWVLMICFKVRWHNCRLALDLGWLTKLSHLHQQGVESWGWSNPDY